MSMHACLRARMYGGYVYVVRLCVLGVRAAHCIKSCTLPNTNPALANRTTNQQPTYPIAYHSMYVIDESSIEQDVLFGHVPTYAPIWRRPYPWMNVGTLFPGVNKKPPPTKFDVCRKDVKGLCIWSDHASSALRSARSPGVRRNNFFQVCRNKGSIAPSRPPHSCQWGNTTVPHMSTRALKLRPCYSQPGHRLC